MSDELSNTSETAVTTSAEGAAPAKKTAAKKSAAKKTTAKKTTAKKSAESAPANAVGDATELDSEQPVKATKKTAAKKSAAKKSAAGLGDESGELSAPLAGVDAPSAAPAPKRTRKSAASIPDFSAPAAEEVAAAAAATAAAATATSLMFQAPSPEAAVAPARRRTRKSSEPTPAAEVVADQDDVTASVDVLEVDDEASDGFNGDIADDDSDESESDVRETSGDDEQGPRRRRRRRGGRGRRRRGGSDGVSDESELSEDSDAADGEEGEAAVDGDADGVGDGTHRRRRRRARRGTGDASELGQDDPPNTVVRVREPRSRTSETNALKGSTRLEAKKQRRREGREAGRRRPSILTEAEFLARREAVDRVMVVRQRDDRTQIAVLEDNVLVEHYVNRSSGASMIGNVYLGRVQNVLPSMEAAFIDVGRGRNAVLYAGEVNWDATGLEGASKRIELALKPGDPVLVQVSKDPIGHKGARLTAQLSLPGRFLVFVPNSSMTGISRKLPDNERSRLKTILRSVLPEDAGVIVRTAAEGASEEELRQDVERLSKQWDDISAKAEASKGSAPVLLHGEPDLAIKVVRDIFNEDFGKLVVEGGVIGDTIRDYVGGVAPDLAERITTWTEPRDMFASYRIDEQLAKALDRKVWLPSGGSLVIDRTEAMTVVDVNTGKFTGQGGNLEETVTSNNIEAAEEIVRQLRLRDIGGIIVIDFIDMVLESNRDLVLRRLVECLGRDRTKHQVAEVTTLGLVQMTRKRIGQGLLEVFSESCDACHGRGYHIHSEPVVAKAAFDEDDESTPRGRHDGDGQGAGGRSRGRSRSRASEVEPRAIDPEVSAVLERIHAAAAKSTIVEASPAQDGEADSTTTDSVDSVSVDVSGADAAPKSVEGSLTQEQAPAAPEASVPVASADSNATQNSGPRKRGSRRATRASGSSPVTTVTATPTSEPIVVVSSPAPAVVTVTSQISASLVELDSTPAPRARGPRKATRSAGPASVPTGSTEPNSSDSSDHAGDA